MRKVTKPLGDAYPRIYRMMRKTQFSAFKTIEILYDAKRGDKHALAWIRMMKGMRP